MPNKMHSFENNSSNVPAFLIKLWKLVEDPSCNDLIAWSDNGTSFIIQDQTRFSKELLPLYFKHNNMASFIRQLNMYGFRKVINYEKTGLKGDNDEMEFQHSFFLKGQIGLLELIKRKIPNSKVTIAEPTIKSNARDILTDLSSIREKQENMDNMLLKMKQENELLWRELTSMRQKHKAQEQIIQKVIQFLVSIVQQSNSNIGVGVQRKMARMLKASASNKGNSQLSCTLDLLRNNKSSNFITASDEKLVSPLGPVIHEVTDLDAEQEDSAHLSPNVKSPEERTEDINNKKDENEVQEIEGLLTSSLNSPIENSMPMEPLSILERLEPKTPVSDAVLSPEDVNLVNLEESVLGIPLDFIVVSDDNVISIPEQPPNNVISLPGPTKQSTEQAVFNSSKDLLDTMSESLQTPKILTIEDICPSPMQSDKQQNAKNKMNTNHLSNVLQDCTSNNVNTEHNYQLTLSDPSVVKPSSLNKNTLSNHLLNVEEELNWLQDQIASNSWSIDASKLLGLFSTDAVANNEALAGEIASESNIKTEPTDVIGKELVQFTPSLLEVDLGSSPYFENLIDDPPVPSKNDAEQKNFLLVDVLNSADQEAASNAAEYLLSNGSVPKHKSPRFSKVQKIQKAKRRKLK